MSRSVWAVGTVSNSGYAEEVMGVEGLFSTREAAERFVSEMGSLYYVEEFVVLDEVKYSNGQNGNVSISGTLITYDEHGNERNA